MAGLRALLPFVRQERGLILAAGAALILAAAATLLVPLAVRRVIDFGFSDATSGMVDAYFGMILIVVMVLAVASSLRYALVMTLGERVVARVRAALFERVMTLDAAFFDTARAGEIVSRLTADTTQIKSAFGASASIALRNTLLFIGALVMMFITSPWLSALIMGAIPVIVLPLVAAGRGVRSRSRAAQDTLADAAGFATERIGAARTVQGLGAEGATVATFSGANGRAYSGALAAIKARAWLTAIIIFLVFASVTAILWYGAHSVIAGQMSAGRLSQFVLYTVFAASALGQLSEVFGELSQASGAAARIGELLATEPRVREPAVPLPPPAPARGAITFEDVRFSYAARLNGTESPAGTLAETGPQAAAAPAPPPATLGPLSLAIAPGEKLAIVGPSGAGKSTLLALLMRFYDPSDGAILIDGVSIAKLRLRDLRGLIGYVPQDPVIFAATIRENIAIARPGADDGAIRAAAEKAAAWSFIEKLPQGLDTPVGERGITLSGGERQRLAIARVILRDAPILLLDEATSALDAANERAVQQALEGAMAGRTALVVAHRLATVRAADRIIVLDAGTIAEEGTHDTLVAQGGLYARLASLQFTQG